MRKLLAASLALFLVIGCKTPALTKSVARSTTSSAVILAAAKDPKVVPYFKLVTPIFCQAAEGTNRYTPDQVTYAITNNPAAVKVKTLAAIVVVNTLISLYSAAYDESSDANFQAVSEGICLGLQDSLAFFEPQAVPAPGTSPIPQPAIRRQKLPPHVE